MGWRFESPHVDEITSAIARLTIRLWLYRLVRREPNMPLEIKGLKANMLRFQKRIETLNQLAVSGDEKGGELEQALRDIGTQINGHVEDLNFAATVLGNSAGASAEAVEKPKPPPVSLQQFPLQAPEQPPAASPAAILNGSPGMQGTHDVQLIRS